MIENIVLIADIHFRTFKRHLEFRAVSETFFAHMKDLKPDRIVIAGDIVHSRNQVTPELIEEVSWFLRNCSEVCGRVVIIPGNHDVVEQNMDRMDTLHPIINAIKVGNIDYLVENKLYLDENIVWSVYSIYNNCMMPVDLPAKPFGLDKKYIGLYHGLILGAKNDKGFEFHHGADLTSFNLCDMTLCGDIHKRQVLFSNPSLHPVIMVGSFIQQDHAETISNHGYCSIKVSDMSYKFTDIENPVKYYTYLVRDIEDIYEEREILKNS